MITRILVDVDSRATHHPSLDWAVAIATRTGAEIIVADVMSDDQTPAEQLVDLTERRLATVAGAVTKVAVRHKVLVGSPAAALITEVERSGADLLVRSHARDLSAMRPKPYGPIDRELVRGSPAPVLLAAPGVRPRHPQIVGAVAPDDGEARVEALNRTIISSTAAWSSILDGSPTVLQAWTPVLEWRLSSQCSGDELAGYTEESRQQVIAQMTAAVRDAGADPREVGVAARRGVVDDVLPSFIVSRGIDLVVLGVTPRRGLSRLVLGNTAERLLRHLPCSVLTVKPDHCASGADAAPKSRWSW